MRAERLVAGSATGAVVTAICCFTPALAWLLPALGIGAWLAFADLVLLPALALFLALAAYGLWKIKLTRSSSPPR